MLKNKTEKKSLQKEKKSRAKYKCPTELEELINQVNLLPPDFQLKNLTFVLEEQRHLLQLQTGDNQVIPSILQALNSCLEQTPEDFQKYIEREALKHKDPFGIAKPPNVAIYNIHAKAKVYSEYFVMRNSMLSLLQRLETERQLIRDAEISNQLKEGSALLDWETFPLTINTVLKRDAKGKLQITGLAALIGTFDDSRLRRCVICQRIYWAKREDSKTCSSSCLNVFNVRNYRSLTIEEKAKRKAQREENKRYKQKAKK